MKTAHKTENILLIIWHLMALYGKDYVFPTQKKLMELLKTYRKCPISRATLCRWLRDIEDHNYIHRKRRIKRHKKYGLMFDSTMYFDTIQGVKLMIALGHKASKKLSALLTRLRYKYPEFAVKSKKKKLSEEKKNPNRQENIRKILTQLGENLAA